MLSNTRDAVVSEATSSDLLDLRPKHATGRINAPGDTEYGPVLPEIVKDAAAIVEGLDAPLAAASMLPAGTVRPGIPRPVDRPSTLGSLAASRQADPVVDAGGTGGEESHALWLDEYAKAVLYNGLGQYHDARLAASHACASDEFELLEGALLELVEASVRSGARDHALIASRRLEARARMRGSAWAVGLACCGHALVADDEDAEASYLEALEQLRQTHARAALGRAHLLYGEWLRRRRRRVKAREHLATAHRVFCEVRASAYAARARRELAATGHVVRRAVDRHLKLSARELQVAELAATRRTNVEIGEQLFVSPRTVEWHLRNIFTKLGVTSRKELDAALESVTPLTTG